MPAPADQVPRAPAGGWAMGPQARDLGFAHFPDSLWPSAAIDAWTPPHPLSITAAMCEELLACAAGVEPEHTSSADYFYDLSMPQRLRAELVDRCAAANAAWWRLELTTWHFKLKRYRPGERHVPHQDLLPMTPRRKLAAVVQLSEPDAYAGGDLTAHIGPNRAAMPRARGTLVVFPGWTVHEVTPVTAGERWSLCINAQGPTLR